MDLNESFLCGYLRIQGKPPALSLSLPHSCARHQSCPFQALAKRFLQASQTITLPSQPTSKAKSLGQNTASSPSTPTGAPTTRQTCRTGQSSQPSGNTLSRRGGNTALARQCCKMPWSRTSPRASTSLCGGRSTSSCRTIGCAPSRAQASRGSITFALTRCWARSMAFIFTAGVRGEFVFLCLGCGWCSTSKHAKRTNMRSCVRMLACANHSAPGVLVVFRLLTGVLHRFQQLELKHVEDRGCFSALEFR